MKGPRRHRYIFQLFAYALGLVNKLREEYLNLYIIFHFVFKILATLDHLPIRYFSFRCQLTVRRVVHQSSPFAWAYS